MTTDITYVEEDEATKEEVVRILLGEMVAALETQVKINQGLDQRVKDIEEFLELKDDQALARELTAIESEMDDPFPLVYLDLFAAEKKDE